jgi:hypothetical protein
MPAEQFDMWKLFYFRNPYDPETLYSLPAAMVCSTLMNCHRAPGSRVINPRDLMRKRTTENPVDVDQKIIAAVARHNASLKQAAPE